VIEHVLLEHAHPLLFFFSVTSPPEDHTLSLHDALPISSRSSELSSLIATPFLCVVAATRPRACCTTWVSSWPSSSWPAVLDGSRSEEHTSELQSRGHLVCRLPLEK